ncbi:hypothetical protein DICVIV_08969 [Dictyocaulus viviparus]|uniref:Uncharacterized protein n=1 Tax=Dictyocaulus viviparus TaxID=29172 RepID=A0A0D8XK69_DICVI|nr:hypothetical protein DICVIV_08969 [Dictyocaulus viviparus]
MRAYEFVTNTPIKLDEHRDYFVDDVALVRSSPPLSPPIKGNSAHNCAMSSVEIVFA